MMTSSTPAPLNKHSSALEVGIGTGQATRPILETGCQITAVELGDQMAAFVREKFKEHPNFSVVNCPFQNYECPDNSIDLIYSASAFHWIPEEIGYKKVFDALRPGGVFARFALGKPSFFDEIREMIDAHGGLFTIYDTIDLQLARKPE